MRLTIRDGREKRNKNLRRAQGLQAPLLPVILSFPVMPRFFAERNRSLDERCSGTGISRRQYVLYRFLRSCLTSRGCLKNRNSRLFLQKAAAAASKMRGIQQVFLCFFPCGRSLFTNHPSISLFSNKPYSFKSYGNRVVKLNKK